MFTFIMLYNCKTVLTYFKLTNVMFSEETVNAEILNLITWDVIFRIY